MPNLSQTVILVVEDDAAIRRGLVDSLVYAGYCPRECDNGTSAITEALDPAVELVLLDIMLPGCDGFHVLQELRRTRPTLSVIMLSARGTEEDRVRGLKEGADDYVVKPFSARELLARVEAVLRRAPEEAWGIRFLRKGECHIDLQECTVSKDGGEAINLTEREVAILRFLAVNEGRVVGRKDLLHRVWGMNSREIETRTVDMHMVRLREKVEVDPANPEIILTVRGKGYRLADSVEVKES